MSPRLPFATYAVVGLTFQMRGMRNPSSGFQGRPFARSTPPRNFIATARGPESGHSRAYSTCKRRPPGEKAPSRSSRSSGGRGGYRGFVPIRDTGTGRTGGLVIWGFLRVPSIFDDLDALSAVTRFSRPDFDHERHLESAARHDGHAYGEAGDFLGHRGRETFDTRDDRLQIVRVRELQDDLRVALAQHVLVYLGGPLRNYDQPEAELPPFPGEGPEHLRRGRLADLGTEVVGLLHDQHHRRDPCDLPQLEHRGRQTIHHEFLDVRRNALQVDD